MFDFLNNFFLTIKFIFLEGEVFHYTFVTIKIAGGILSGNLI